MDATLALVVTARAQCTYAWPAAPFAGGADDSVRALTVDGSGNLIAGGRFANVGTTAASRIARWNNGWQPLGLTPEALGQGMALLREEARACGRDAAQIPVSLALSITASTPRRFALGTEPAEIARTAQAFARLGVETLVISATTSDPRAARSALEMVGEILPALSGARSAV